MSIIIENEETNLYSAINEGEIQLEVIIAQKQIKDKENSKLRGECPLLLDDGRESSVSGSSVSIESGSKNSGSVSTAELIDRSFSNESPSSIKKLRALLIFLLLVILSLIATEADLICNEAMDLQNKFPLIEAYETRYRYSMMLYNFVELYDTTKYGGLQSSYTMAMAKIKSLMNQIATANVNTRLYFAQLGLNYDSYNLMITDHGSLVSYLFSHALIKVSNCSVYIGS